MTQAKTRYEYTFSRTVNGLPVDQMDGSFILNETDGTYAPPFPVETISIAVTEDGVQFFQWCIVGTCRQFCCSGDTKPLFGVCSTVYLILCADRVSGAILSVNVFLKSALLGSTDLLSSVFLHCNTFSALYFGECFVYESCEKEACRWIERISDRLFGLPGTIFPCGRAVRESI